MSRMELLESPLYPREVCCRHQCYCGREDHL